MEKTRNRGWRRSQQDRVLKARMQKFSSWGGYTIFDETGSRIDNAHWFEIAQQRWVKKYKDSSTPCSCWLCSGEKYNRIDYVKETQRMIRESLE